MNGLGCTVFSFEGAFGPQILLVTVVLHMQSKELGVLHHADELKSISLAHLGGSSHDVVISGVVLILVLNMSGTF